MNLVVNLCIVPQFHQFSGKIEHTFVILCAKTKNFFQNHEALNNLLAPLLQRCILDDDDEEKEGSGELSETCDLE